VQWRDCVIVELWYNRRSIPLGAVENNIDEVLNTTEAISNILYYYLKGEANG